MSSIKYYKDCGCNIPGTNWSIVHSPWGQRTLCLLVSRGISCEFNIQSYSCHMNSDICAGIIVEVIQEHAERFVKMIDGMIEFVHVLPPRCESSYDCGKKERVYKFKQDFERVDQMADAFCHMFLRHVCDLCEEKDINNMDRWKTCECEDCAHYRELVEKQDKEDKEYEEKRRQEKMKKVAVGVFCRIKKDSLLKYYGDPGDDESFFPVVRIVPPYGLMLRSYTHLWDVDDVDIVKTKTIIEKIG